MFANLLSRTQAERELQKLRQDLGHINRVATVGELTASLAHELHQPLAAILSNAQAAQNVLKADPVDLGEIRAILKDIVDDDKRAGAVIHRVHALLRKDGVEFTDLDVNDLVSEVAGLVRGDVALRHASLRLELAPRLPRVRGDRVQLQQVVLNLVLNGLEAMQESSPAVGYSSSGRPGRARPSSGWRCGTSGPAIDEADLGHIFQTFYTTKRAGWGWVGDRALHRRSARRAAGGREQPGWGATFSFTLPSARKGHRRR